MGGARHSDRDAGDLRRRAVDCGRHHRHGHDTPHRDAAEGGGRVFGVAAMTFDIGMPMIPDAALFELMSIPLYVLTGFVKRQDAAPEAALKFFLVGTASSAVIVYGISFIIGVTGSTDLAAIPTALVSNDPMMLLGMTLLLAGLGFKIAAFPFHMWAPDTYEAAS